MPVSTTQFVDRLATSGLLSPEQAEEWLSGFDLADTRTSGDDLAQALVRQGKLTPFQAQALCEGGQELVIDEYEIREQIGEGGMGQVFKARHRRMERIVALKVIHERYCGSPSAEHRFRREILAISRLKHRNLVCAFDSRAVRGTQLLVMEYVEGLNLSQLVKRDGPLPVARAVGYVVQMAEGLQHAHEHGIVHRDVKPRNVLVDATDTIKILDLGLARFDTRLAVDDTVTLTSPGEVMGTVDYMSPEQSANSPQVNRRTDIYSLGCTLHYLLTGRTLFAGDTALEKLLAHRERPIPSLRSSRPEVSAELDSVFRLMVAKSPDDRFQSMAEVLAALGRLPDLPQSGRTGAIGASPPKRQSRWRNRFPPRQSQLLVLLVFVGCMGLAVSVGGRVPPLTAPPLTAGPLSVHPLPVPSPPASPENTAFLANTVPPAARRPVAPECAVETPSRIVAAVQGGVPVVSAEHQVAEWILERGGTLDAVGTLAGPGLQTIHSREQLSPNTAGLEVHRATLIRAQIRDEEFGRLAPLSKLVFVDLTRTSVGDAGLELLCGLPQIEALYLMGTAVTDAGVRHLTRLPRLRVVDLRGTSLTDSTLQELGRISTLDTLMISGTGQITDQGLQHLAGLTSLLTLAVRDTLVTDQGLSALKSMKRLSSLDLSRTRITDEGCLALQGLPELEHLELCETAVSETAIANLSTALPRCRIAWGKSLDRHVTGPAAAGR